MNVIGDAAHLDGGTFDVVQCARHVGVELCLDGGRENRFAVLGAEDQVDQDAG
jgi:hypothetical protein